MAIEWKTLGEVATYINGRAFKPAEWENDGLPIIRIQNLTDDTAKYNYSSEQFEEKYLVKKGDLLFAWSASLGAHIWNKADAWLNQHIFKVVPNAEIDRDYLYYYLCKVTAELYAKAHGTGMVHITKKPFMETPIPVPSLNEQKRVVSKIEEMLSSLENAVETLNKTKEQLAVYRQAVLKEAFNSTKESEMVRLQDIVDDIRIGPFGTMLHKSDYIDDGVPVINPKHIKDQRIVPSSKVTISETKAIELNSYRLKQNDVIMGRRGEMGRTAPITDNEEGWICGTGSVIIRLKEQYDCVFYSQILSSPDTVHFLEEQSTGTTMNNLNEGIVKSIPIPKITYEEERIIKQQLDSKVSVCQNIEDTINEALMQAEAMRQSILKEAFEGRLE